MRALESASVDQDIIPFTQFVGRLVQSQMDGKEIAQLPTK